MSDLYWYNENGQKTLKENVSILVLLLEVIEWPLVFLLFVCFVTYSSFITFLPGQRSWELGTAARFVETLVPIKGRVDMEFFTKIFFKKARETSNQKNKNKQPSKR